MCDCITPYQQPSDNNKHDDSDNHDYNHDSNDNHEEEPGRRGRAQTTPDARRLGYRCVFFPFFVVFLILTNVYCIFRL